MAFMKMTIGGLTRKKDFMASSSIASCFVETVLVRTTAAGVNILEGGAGCGRVDRGGFEYTLGISNLD